MFNTRKSRFRILIILIVVGLLSLIPLIIKMDYFFGISKIKNQTFDSDIDVSVTMDVEFWSLTENLVIYSYYVDFDLTFNSSITAVEIEKIEGKIYRNTGPVVSFSRLPHQSYGSGFEERTFVGRSRLEFGDNLTCQGFVDINYQLNNNPQNSTVNYNLVYTHDVKEYDAYTFNLFKGFVTVAYIASFPLLPLILYFIIHPDFHELSEKEKEENEEFFHSFTKNESKGK